MLEFSYFYCPCCGKFIQDLKENPEPCPVCNTMMIKTSWTEEEWKLKSIKEQEKIIENLRETLVKTNPLYNEEKFKAREYDESHMEFGTMPNLPKCPACGSTNIQKISTASKVGAGIAFGVFSLGHISKTFKCKNCGYKF